jgi:hypothetical protein
MTAAAAWDDLREQFKCSSMTTRCIVSKTPLKAILLSITFAWVGSFAAARSAQEARSPSEATPKPRGPRVTNQRPAQPTSRTVPQCSLTATQLEERRDELLPGFLDRAESVTDMRHGVRMRFAHRPGLVTELAALIEQEQTCCSFLSFRLITTEGAGPVTLEVRGPRGTSDLLRKLRRT